MDMSDSLAFSSEGDNPPAFAASGDARAIIAILIAQATEGGGGISNDAAETPGAALRAVLHAVTDGTSNTVADRLPEDAIEAFPEIWFDTDLPAG